MTELYTNINPNKLHEELLAAGIIPLRVDNDMPKGAYIAPNTWITYPDGTDMDKVAQVVAAHTTTPPTQPPTAEERLAALENAMLAIL